MTSDESKYQDRRLEGLFASDTISGNPQQDARSSISNLQEMLLARGLVKATRPIVTSKTRAILAEHGADETSLPIHFSQSSADYAPAIDNAELYDQRMAGLPANGRYLEATVALKALHSDLSEKMLREPLSATLPRAEALLRQSRERWPRELMNEIEDNIERYHRAEPAVRSFMRRVISANPRMKDIIISDNQAPPYEEFIKSIETDYYSMPSRDQQTFAMYCAEYQSIISSITPILYPDEYQRYSDSVNSLSRLQEDMASEGRSSQGFVPPKIVDHAHRQLIERHGVSQDTINQSYVGVCNGSSVRILKAALKVGLKPGQAIITPELHWDGYDYAASECGFPMMQTPRGESIQAYMEKNFPLPRPVKDFRSRISRSHAEHAEPGCLLVTNPCSITGKACDKDMLRSYLKVARDYDIPLIFNEINASPDEKGNTFQSIASLPEFKDVKNKIMILSSISKTGNIPDLVPKLSYFMTGNKKWGDDTAQEIENSGRSFQQEDVVSICAYMDAVDRQYHIKNEGISKQKRNKIEDWMKKINASTQMEAVKWYEGRPDKGYISSLEFNSDLLQKAGIHSSLELFEYLYKVGGISTGVLLPVTKDGREPKIGARINYSFDDKKLDLGFSLMEHAVSEMQQGLTLERAREICPAPQMNEHVSAMDIFMMAALQRGMGGGSGRVVFVDPDGQQNRDPWGRDRW